MDDVTRTLLAAASAASSAATDLVEAARDGNPRMGNVASGETAIALADALRLVIGVTEEPVAGQLGVALDSFLEDRT